MNSAVTGFLRSLWQQRLIRGFVRYLVLWPLRYLARLVEKKGAFIYLPPFDTLDELADQYHRALWYLPEDGGCSVSMVVGGGLNVSLDALHTTAPDCMQSPPSSGKNIRIVSARSLASAGLFFASPFVLVWHVRRMNYLLRVLGRALGKKVIEIDPQHPDCYEYYHYLVLLTHLQSTQEREQRRAESRARFEELAEKLGAYSRAYVFGTGPSLQSAHNFDFSDGVRIVCNSIVKNKELLAHTRPHFIVAADTVSHFGVSRYAAAFRRDLVDALDDTEAYFVFPEQFEPLWRLHYPHLRSRCIAIPLSLEFTRLSLLDDFRGTGTESVLTIFMLPLATTLAKKVLFLGCDGRLTQVNQEDFWAHEASVQYLDLVETGHQCHPTFAYNRERKGTYSRYNEFVEMAILAGEEDDIEYVCLSPSGTPALRSRQGNAESWRKNDRKWVIHSLHCRAFGCNR